MIWVDTSYLLWYDLKRHIFISHDMSWQVKSSFHMIWLDKISSFDMIKNISPCSFVPGTRVSSPSDASQTLGPHYHKEVNEPVSWGSRPISFLSNVNAFYMTQIICQRLCRPILMGARILLQHNVPPASSFEARFWTAACPVTSVKL